MTSHQLAKMLLSLPDQQVVLQPTANDKARPCAYVLLMSSDKIVLSTTGKTKKGGEQ